MVFLGNSILGNLNKEATSQKSLGLPFWRLVIASGIIVLVMGPINILTVSTIAISSPGGRVLRWHRASSFETRKRTSPPVKSDLTVQSLLTRPMSKPRLQNHQVDAATTDHSSSERSAILCLLTTLARPRSRTTWLKHPRCILQSPVPFSRRLLPRVQVGRVQSTAKVPRVNDIS